MKKITSNSVVYGPFDSVETLEDSYKVTYNGGEGIYPFNVIGQGVVADWTDPLPPLPPVDLNPYKAQKNEEINEARLKANFTSFTHAGKAIACDQLSRSDIDGANGYVALNDSLPPGWPGGWKAIDNSYVVIQSVADWKAFYLSMFAAGNANFAKAQNLKQQLTNADTLEEVQAIKW